jgi:hypothetical protein
VVSTIEVGDSVIGEIRAFMSSFGSVLVLRCGLFMSKIDDQNSEKSCAVVAKEWIDFMISSKHQTSFEKQIP